MLDALNFIITGYFGFTFIIMTILSKIALKIENNFYNKLLLPISFIALYSFVQAIIFFYFFNDIAILKNLVIATALNNFILIIIWIITKEPIHD